MQFFHSKLKILMIVGLIHIATCFPQGYNYPKTTSNVQKETLAISTSAYNTGSSSGNHNQFLSSQSSSNLPTRISQPNSGHVSSSNNENVYHQQNAQNLAPIITKSIFIHSAPEDTEDDSDFARQLSQTPLRKNYRIIFIKTPTPNLGRIAQKLRQAQQQQPEEKTVIYVLSKKTDLSDVQDQLNQIKSQSSAPSKPEVFFIKYKTAEEAAHAQNEIQSQYDALGGSTQISDEGYAPVTSVIGSLQGQSQQSYPRQSGGGNIAQSSSQTSSFIGLPSVQNSSNGPIIVSSNIPGVSNQYLPSARI